METTKLSLEDVKWEIKQRANEHGADSVWISPQYKKELCKRVREMKNKFTCDYHPLLDQIYKYIRGLKESTPNPRLVCNHDSLHLSNISLHIVHPLFWESKAVLTNQILLIRSVILLPCLLNRHDSSLNPCMRAFGQDLIH